MNEMSNLYKTALHQLEISEDDQAVLEQVGYSLVGQADAFRKLQLVIFKKESLYSYSSLLGTSVEMEFDWDSSIACLTYLDSEVKLPMKDFMLWLSYTDLLLAPVLPLVSAMEDAKVPFMATIMGRRIIPEPDDKEYIDYMVSIYPYGMRLDVEPLFIPSYLISQVIHKGYSDTFDQDYVDQQFRKDYFQHNILSLTHSTEGEIDEN